MQIIIAIIALSFLIIVHEFGHFIVAKLSGIKVLEFSLFMGPKIWSTQKGETVYSIRAVPLGGYVKMEGEEESSDDARAFNRKPMHIRAAVIAAGPIMNLIVAVIIIALVSSFTGFSTDELTIDDGSPAQIGGLQNGDKIISYNDKKIFHYMDVLTFLYVSKGEPVKIEVLRDDEKITKTVTPEKIPEQSRYILGFIPKESEGPESNVVKDITSDSPAQKAGMKTNDRIVKLNGELVENRQQIGEFLKKNGEKPVEVVVNRNGEDVPLNSPIIPKLEKTTEQYYLGVNFKSVNGGFLDAVRYSVAYTASISRSVYYSIAWLLSGKLSVSQLMGPVGIVSTIGDVVQQSPTLMDKFLGLLGFTAFISINLGVFNLIPFPALDGSKLLLIAIEGIRRKSIPPEKEAYISMVGLVLLIMLMIFATSNDVLRLMGKG